MHLTQHARIRMDARSIPKRAVEMVLDHGRRVFIRGAELAVIGRKEIVWAKMQGLDLRDYNGIHVVCAEDGTVLTVYRNRALPSLRPRRNGRRGLHRRRRRAS